MTTHQLTEMELEGIKKQGLVRKALAKNSHFWFFSIYLGHYIKYPFAPFHFDIFQLTECESIRLAVLMAFRGSAKSTLITLSYVIWSIIGIQQKKFILIISQTQAQAKMHMENLKRELEGNALLKSDIGPFEEISDEWGSNSIVISKYGARITVASTEQSIRGIRHGEHRPDLVICDDLEDLNSVKTKEGRDKTYRWFNGEIQPIGDEQTKIVIIGNLLHEDSLLMRLKQAIENGELEGKFFSYPLLGKNNEIAWSSRFKTLQDIEKLKATVGNDFAWHQEYLLKIISDTERVVHPEWIHRYNKLPSENSEDFLYTATGIDVAISEKESADCTAMVSGRVFGSGEDLKVYILPNSINKRMSFPETIETATALAKVLKSELFIEDVGIQGGLAQILQNYKNISAEGVKIGGRDKRSRLALVTHLIQQGKVLFPEKGAEELIQQLLGFGIEKHEDLVDAFSLLLLKIIERDNSSEPNFFIYNY